MAARLHETDSEDDQPLHQSKKKKVATVAKQKFRRTYTELWPCLDKSSKGEYFVHCKLCKKDFSCSHGGKNDCKKHINSLYHRDLVNRTAASGSMKNYLVRNSTIGKQHSLLQQTVAAEVTMCDMIAELNLSLASSDSLVRSFKKMFPDSAIAKGMHCSRNKTTAVIKEIAKTAAESLVERMKNQPYTISTDGSNDSSSKQYPIVVRTFNAESGLVTSELLSLAICNGPSTGENIFKLLDSELKSAGVDWRSCLALGCDNANVMVGQHKGVYAYVKAEHSEVFLAGCTLHMIHNGAKKAATECMPPFEEVLTDIYYFFQKSSSRLENFRGDQEFGGTGQRKILKHVCTRWLSISRCLARMIENWDALKVYFANEKQELAKKGTQSESYAARKVENIYPFIRSPTNCLFAHFLIYVHSLMETVLLSFQAEEPKIHVLGRCLHRLVRSIFQCFLKPSALTGKLLHEVHYMQPYSLKSNNNILIGDQAEAFLRNKEENHLRDERIADFYKAVKSYFQVLSKYLLDKLPLSDPLLIHAKVVDPTLRENPDGSTSLKFFLDRYPSLLPKGATRQKVLEQFSAYQCSDHVEHCISERIDMTWVALGKLTDEENELCFKELSEVMCGILTIPHSSAHCERVFSCVRKNRTDQRSSLSDKTMESLLLLKSRPGCFCSRSYTSLELDRFKSAYHCSLTGK